MFIKENVTGAESAGSVTFGHRQANRFPLTVEFMLR